MRTGQEKEERGTEEEDEKRKGKEKVEEGRKERSALWQCRVVKERAPRWLTFWSDALKTKLAPLTFPSLPPSNLTSLSMVFAGVQNLPVSLD